MKGKIVLYGEEARQGLKRGMDKLANAVKVTLGPKGRSIIFDRDFSLPVVTKDGATVAREVELTDRLENAGAKLIKEVAGRTNETAGDGTTTATVLAQTLITEGMKMVAAGIDPLAIRRGMEKGAQVAIDEIKNSVAKKVEDGDLLRVATISANDADIGKIISEAMEKVGERGAISVEESNVGTLGITTEVTQGMRWDHGWTSHYMVTDRVRMTAEYENVPIFVTDEKLTLPDDVIPILKKAIEMEQKQCVIIAADVTEHALAFLVANRMQGKFNALAVRAPGFAMRKKDYLDDIAVLTGATVISKETGRTISSVQSGDFGKAGKVVAGRTHTTVIDGCGDKAKIEERVSLLKQVQEKTDSETERQRMREQIGKLTSGVGVIRVGAASETEMIEKRHRIEDAICATRAALEEGIVPGGGKTLVFAKNALEGIVGLSRDEQVGVDIMKKAFEEPVRQIAKNAGKDGAVILDKISNLPLWEGYDAAKDVYCDLMAAGIVDPAKVTRCAIQNAVSVTATILTTEGIIIDDPKEKKKAKKVDIDLDSEE